MTLVKHLILCLGLSLLLTACKEAEQLPIEDPALTQADPCTLIPDPGPCKAAIEQYFFDQKTQQCSTFIYGGCQGTVPFETMAACQSSCETHNYATDTNDTSP